MLVILFAWGLLLLPKLSSLPCSHCGLVNGSIRDAVLLQVSVVRKCEHPPFSSGSGRPTAYASCPPWPREQAGSRSGGEEPELGRFPNSIRVPIRP